MSGSPFGILEAYSAKKAGDQQVEAAGRATDIELQMYNQSRADLAPWREAGANALTKLQPMISAGPGEFKESPSYQFALEQGQQGIQRAASATGRLGSGAYMKDATKYAEGMASQEYGNFLQRYYDSLKPYQSLAGLGQTSAGQQALVNTNTGNSLANTYGNAGAAQAAGILGQYNSVANSMGNAGNQIGNYMMNQQGQNALTQNWGYSPAGQSYWGGTMAGSAAGANSMIWL